MSEIQGPSNIKATLVAEENVADEAETDTTHVRMSVSVHIQTRSLVEAACLLDGIVRTLLQRYGDDWIAAVAEYGSRLPEPHIETADAEEVH